MATKLFVDFDSVSSSSLLANGSGPSGWSQWAMPAGLFHNAGVATQDQTVSPPATPTGTNSHFQTGRTANSTALGGNSVAYTPATFRTYAQANTAQLHQVAVKRSVWGLGAEIWATLDFSVPCNTVTSFSSAVYTQPHDYDYIFKFGDVGIKLKSTTYSSVFVVHDVVFSVMNNGAEVATISVPSVTVSQWLFMKVHIKLDATTGVAEFVVNGVTQSAAYTGQNTVVTTTLVAADHIYFGPGVFNSPGTSTCYVGVIDNVLFDDAAWPTGRPRGERWALSADSTLVNFAATSGTVTNALANSSDGLSARGTGAGASALLTPAAYTTTSLNTNIIGFNLYVQRISNRDLDQVRGLSVGMSLAGVHTMDTVIAGLAVPYDLVTTPPAGNYTAGMGYVYAPSGGGSYTITDLSTIKVRLLTF